LPNPVGQRFAALPVVGHHRKVNELAGRDETTQAVPLDQESTAIVPNDPEFYRRIGSKNLFNLFPIRLRAIIGRCRASRVWIVYIDTAPKRVVWLRFPLIGGHFPFL
jgi:hypothetical protein